MFVLNVSRYPSISFELWGKISGQSEGRWSIGIIIHMTSDLPIAQQPYPITKWIKFQTSVLKFIYRF